MIYRPKNFEIMSTKEKIYNQLQNQLTDRIDAAKQLMDSHKESLQSDTKSTAGDKHETGRAMIQIEYEGSIKQWKTAVDMKNALDRIDPSIEKPVVGLGSLVTTNQGNYYLSISLGKVTIEEMDCFAISLGSPIGKFLLGKVKGEEFEFMNKQYQIGSIE